jgi:hypothetical protein
MNRRRAWLFGSGAVWVATSGFLACGGGAGTPGDGGMEASPGDATTMFDVPTDSGSDAADRTVNHNDGPSDGGGDVVTTTDTGLTGHCSRVNGPACDVVLQNCPTGQECVIVNDSHAESGLGLTTMCQDDQSSEHLPAGSPCCPQSPSNECKAGLTCQGANCEGDAGGGRCTPACCPGDAGPIPANCGSSPEGYIGICDLGITEADGAVIFDTCIYAATCTVFVSPCGSGYTCIVEEKSGASKCVEIFGIDGGTTGVPAGGRCAAENACAANLECISFGTPDGSYGPSTCTYLCYTGTGSPPFDAGVLTGKPGSGGCPPKTTCEGNPASLPSWLGVCAPS